MTDTTLLSAALDYAQHGWPVFPCHPSTKRPLTPGGEGGTGGLKLASTDEAEIRKWWKQYPKAMIGIPTGTKIGAFVLDLDAGIDDKTGEFFEIGDLERQLADELGVALPSTVTSETPRGGRHLYFAVAGADVLGNRTGLVPRVDVRGEGGYVVVPPSVRPDGRAYRWMVAPW
jgi:putative DNA primase/helicase